MRVNIHDPFGFVRAINLDNIHALTVEKLEAIEGVFDRAEKRLEGKEDSDGEDEKSE